MLQWLGRIKFGLPRLTFSDPSEGWCQIFAGSGAEENRNHRDLKRAGFAQPSGLSLRSDVLYVADSESSSVRKIQLPSGPVTWLVGGQRDPTDLFGFGDRTDSPLACLQHPLAVLAEGDLLIVADTYNGKLKRISGEGKHAKLEAICRDLDEPSGLAWSESILWIADTNNHRILKVIYDGENFSEPKTIEIILSHCHQSKYRRKIRRKI